MRINDNGDNCPHSSASTVASLEARSASVCAQAEGHARTRAHFLQCRVVPEDAGSGEGGHRLGRRVPPLGRRRALVEIYSSHGEKAWRETLGRAGRAWRSGEAHAPPLANCHGSPNTRSNTQCIQCLRGCLSLTKIIVRSPSSGRGFVALDPNRKMKCNAYQPHNEASVSSGLAREPRAGAASFRTRCYCSARVRPRSARRIPIS